MPGTTTVATNSRVELALRAVVMVLLAVLTAAFWRWADRLDALDTSMRLGVETLERGQTELLVKVAELEGEVRRTSELARRNERTQERHSGRPWHDRAGNSIAVQAAEIDRLRKRLERLEGPASEGPP